MRDGALELDRGFSTLGAEAGANWLLGARVVKAMNQIGADMMDKATSFSAAPVVFIAGDDTEAKARVSELCHAIGFEVLDAGDLGQSRLLEALAMVWIKQAFARGSAVSGALVS